MYYHQPNIFSMEGVMLNKIPIKEQLNGRDCRLENELCYVLEE